MKFSIVIELSKSNEQQLQPQPERLTRESWARVREIVKGRDGEVCQYCGRPAPDGEPDHILPLARGGADALTNLVWSCQDCNRSKGARTLREWKRGMQVGQDDRRYSLAIPREDDDDGAYRSGIWCDDEPHEEATSQDLELG